jgi:hypothetical protein
MRGSGDTFDVSWSFDGSMLCSCFSSGVLQVTADHDYAGSVVEEVRFSGYKCMDQFCDWLFTSKNANSTVFAHNAAGYDNKFVLKWCLAHAILPKRYIRQGSRVTLMAFEKFNLRFIDSYNFFL